MSLKKEKSKVKENLKIPLNLGYRKKKWRELSFASLLSNPGAAEFSKVLWNVDG